MVTSTAGLINGIWLEMKGCVVDGLSFGYRSNITRPKIRKALNDIHFLCRRFLRCGLIALRSRRLVDKKSVEKYKSQSNCPFRVLQLFAFGRCYRPNSNVNTTSMCRPNGMKARKKGGEREKEGEGEGEKAKLEWM